MKLNEFLHLLTNELEDSPSLGENELVFDSGEGIYLPTANITNSVASKETTIEIQFIAGRAPTQ